MTRSANRHAEHVIAVLTWPLEDSRNPERGFFLGIAGPKTDASVRKTGASVAKTTNMPKD